MTGKHWLSSVDSKYNSEFFFYQCSNINFLQIHLPSSIYKDVLQLWVFIHSKLQQVTKARFLMKTSAVMTKSDTEKIV